MKKLFIDFARLIWRATPSTFIKRLYSRSFFRLVRNRRIITTVDGLVFDLDLGEMIDASIYLQAYERDVVTAIEQFCRPGNTVLDIGANIGVHTLRFAKTVGESGKVYAFEPMDYAYRKLIHNISLNVFQNIIAYQVVLSDKNLKQQEINFRSSWCTDGKRKNGASIVDFIKLDDWCINEQVNSVDLIKLDVDGNEFSVLQGAQSLIQRWRPIFFIEAVSPHFEDAQKNPFAILCGLNYRLRDIRSGKNYTDLNSLRLLLPPHDPEMTVSINLIAIPESPAIVNF